MGVLDDLPRGVRSRMLSEHETPMAAFAAPEEVSASKAFAYQPGQGRFLLGEIDAQLIGTPATEDRHLFLCAGSRSGKGVSIIVPNISSGGYGGSVLAIDPKGELASITARRRALDLGQKVCVLDPFEITARWCEPYRKSFNPLSILSADNETIIEDAGLIADALIVAGSGKDPHWDDSARNFIETVILHVATAPAYKGNRHLVKVWELVNGKAQARMNGKELRGMEALQEGMTRNGRTLTNKDVGAAIEAGTADFFDKPQNERGSVLSTARRHIKFLGFPKLQKVLRTHEFDLTDLKTAPHGMAVYLCLPAGRMATCSRWFRLFVNLAFEAMGRVPGKPATSVQTLFCLDEFATAIGKLDVIEKAAGLMAGDPYHVKLLVCVQDITQMKALYQDAWETFIGNSGAVIAFGNSDPTTLDFLSQRLGKTSVVVNRGSPVTYKGARDGSRGESWANEVHDLLTAEEVARFFGRERQRALVIIPGRDPVVVQRIAYFDHPAFAGRFDEWP